MSNLVYLAGPITGLTFAGCTDWRQYAIDKLRPIVGLSPMRGKEYLAAEKSLAALGYNDRPMSCSRGIMTRDRFDATRCDVLLVNLLGAKTVSIGTVLEIAWADLSRIPIVCAMEPSTPGLQNPHDHAMISEAIGFRVPTLDEAIHITRAILLETGA